MQPGYERLEEPHKQIEGEILPAVRVPGELEVVPGGLCGEGAARLVRQQHAHVARRCTRDGSRRIRGRRKVGDARDEQSRRAPLHDPMLVRQHLHAQPLELRHPPTDIPVVLVIARDEVRAMRRPQTGQGRDVVAQIRDEPVGHVSRHRHEIRP